MIGGLPDPIKLPVDSYVWFKFRGMELKSLFMRLSRMKKFRFLLTLKEIQIPSVINYMTVIGVKEVNPIEFRVIEWVNRVFIKMSDY